jgi:hypothetical protein
MAIDVNQLASKAFYVEENVRNATEALQRAVEKYISIYKTSAVSVDLVVPPDADESWARERLLRPLVYYCESEGAPIPKCPGVFVSLFRDANLCCIAVADVIEWAGAQLGLTVEQLREMYGTHELETALR